MHVLSSCGYCWSFSRIFSEASPIEDLFAGEKDAVLYVGASMAAFQAKFPGTPVTPIVSLKASLRRCAFANSFPRNSGSLKLSELFLNDRLSSRGQSIS